MTAPDEPLPHPDRNPAPAGLYIHIPFCVAKCGYCSFTSYPCGTAPPAGYLAAVQSQAERMAAHPLVDGRRFSTLFVGGGTPTVFPGEELGQLIRACLDLYDFTPEAEITVEANPNSIDQAKLAALKKAGVNRLSIGVQSFSDRLLKGIGRLHSRDEAITAVQLARAAGFANLNLDLIYGLPEQTRSHWRETMESALALAPEHLALYCLTVEEGTPFADLAHRHQLPLPDEETVLAMEGEGYGLLARAGYERYEISNFALPGRRSRHNENYWHNGNYLGLGAAAVSCLDHLRFRQVEDPALFASQVQAGQLPLLDLEGLPPAMAFRETVIMGLRLLDGVSIPELEQRFGITPRAYYGPILAPLLARGLVSMDDQRLRLTAKALPVANQVLAELV
ncbi:MAG: radical SAM family heme chaperone HemW [Desulfobulbaceae bacterium]|nr:radical SAM family heme chaperone HemW [Desulfobulbaceae bacterium]